MPGTPSPLDAQRQRLEHNDRLRLTHWIVIGLSIGFMLSAWAYSGVLIEARAKAQFERQAMQVVDATRDRLARYASAITASAAFVSASDQVSLEQWHRYTDTLRMNERFQALHAFGIAYRVARTQREAFERTQAGVYPGFAVRGEHDDPMLLPVSLIWPVRFEHNGIGLDLAREQDRRDAMARSMKADGAQLSGLTTLGVSGKSGLFLINAFGESQGAGAARGAAIAVVLADRLFDQADEGHEKRVLLRLSDQDGLLFEDEGFAARERTDPLSSRVEQTLYGRQWTFQVVGTAALDRESMRWVPTLVLAIGIVINALVLLLFVNLSRLSRLALSYAEKAGTALRLEQSGLASANRDLLTANAELESFGRALSHDLKAPLNGIQILAEFAAEDLAETRIGEQERRALEQHLERMQRQVARGQALIIGMLAYAGLAGERDGAGRVDVRQLVEDIADGLQMPAERLALCADLPVLHTCGTRLGQVFSNLIGNAIKYHPDPGSARVRIAACLQGDMYRFSVDDDGTGIEIAFRLQVFELFKTAHTLPDVDSSGVGLSIVKKAVEQAGGCVSIHDSALGGARIEFTWPASGSGATVGA